jgi:hypothetical protein
VPLLKARPQLRKPECIVARNTTATASWTEVEETRLDWGIAGADRRLVLIQIWALHKFTI